MKVTPLEEELLQVGEYLIRPVKRLLVDYCKSNGLQLDPKFDVHYDMLQTISGLLADSGYNIHNDTNCLMSDNLVSWDLPQAKILSQDIFVLTIILCDSADDHGIHLVHYKTKEAKKADMVSALPMYGETLIHFQPFEVQDLFYHQVELWSRCVSHGMGRCLVISFQYTMPFQATQEELQWHLGDFGIMSNINKWVTADRYVWLTNGLVTFGGSLAVAAPIKTFPGLGNFGVNVNRDALKHRIKLSSNRWLLHPSAKSDYREGTLAKALCLTYALVADCESWEVLATAMFGVELLNWGYILVVTHKAGKVNKGSDERAIFEVHHGPLLEGSPVQLVCPCTVYNAAQSSGQLGNHLLLNHHRNSVSPMRRKYAGSWMKYHSVANSEVEMATMSARSVPMTAANTIHFVTMIAMAVVMATTAAMMMPVSVFMVASLFVPLLGPTAMTVLVRLLVA